jgi:hypothetical protein
MQLRNRGSGRRTRRVATAATLAAIVPLLAGCHARLTDVWSDPSFHGGPFHSLLVVSQRRDDIGRRLWEDALSQEIGARGVSVTPSYRDRPEAPPSRGRLADMLRAGGIEAALVVRPLPAQREAHWVPGWTSYDARTWYDPWRDRPVTVVRPRVHRGYAVVDQIARAQLTLWVGGDEPRMVWAATAETVNPSSGDALRKDIASGLVPALVKAGILPNVATARVSGS